MQSTQGFTKKKCENTYANEDLIEIIFNQAYNVLQHDIFLYAYFHTHDCFLSFGLNTKMTE